jgi:hypothetical protein
MTADRSQKGTEGALLGKQFPKSGFSVPKNGHNYLLLSLLIGNPLGFSLDQGGRP